jgi:DNA-binding Lrp family transcriptional regulator
MAPLTSAQELRLLNDFQSGFPLTATPYATIAEKLHAAEDDVLEGLVRLVAAGSVNRVGAVFRPGAIGVSTLAAMAVPADDLPRVAAIVSARREVNHNYEREHRYNLWFVVTAADPAMLAATLAAIAREARLSVISMPLIDEYWIDLAFDLSTDAASRRHDARRSAITRPARSPRPMPYADRMLASALEDGLALVPRPYARLARAAGTSEAIVLARLRAWLDGGILKRLGVVVRHRALGYTANAMCVWDIPDADVRVLGEALAREDGVTLCYRRERVWPQWPYNLYCMIHGRDRDAVLAHLARLSARYGLAGFDQAVLFSVRAFKQRGARYGLIAAPPVAA